MTTPGWRAQLGTLFETPALFPFQIDLAHGATLLASVNEGFYRHNIFLDARANLAEAPRAWTSMHALLNQREQSSADTRPITFIFHVGHCGSTLLSRLLADHPNCLPLREPLVLRMLAGARRRLDSPASWLANADWQTLLEMSLQLFGRTFTPHQRALLKATSNCNNLILPTLQACTGHNAIWLYVDLESYLASMLRPQARSGIADFSDERILDLHAAAPDATSALHELTEPRLAAMNWCASMLCACEAQKSSYTERLVWCNFQQLLDAPAEQLARLDELIGVHRDLSRALSRRYFNEYSKDPRLPYSPQLRAEELARSRQVFRSEIDDGLRWAERLISRGGPPLEKLASYLRP